MSIHKEECPKEIRDPFLKNDASEALRWRFERMRESASDVTEVIQKGQRGDLRGPQREEMKRVLSQIASKCLNVRWDTLGAIGISTELPGTRRTSDS